MKNRRRNAGNGQNRSNIEPEQQQQSPRRTMARGVSSRVQGTPRPSTTPMRNYSTSQAIDWPLGRELMTYPLDMLRRFRSDVDRFFEDLGTMRTGGSQSMTMWSPRAEMFDRNGRTVVRIELPGLERDDVKVSVWNDRLIIEGERRDEDDQQRRDYYQTEWSYGRFYREISLPEQVDPSEVMANFKNGVLEIELPQSQVTRQRREIEIS